MRPRSRCTLSPCGRGWLRGAQPGEGFSPRIHLPAAYAERTPHPPRFARHLLPQGEKGRGRQLARPDFIVLQSTKRLAEETTMATIAFIGLGNMGGPMAANLVKAGHKVVAFDLVEASRAQAKADGAGIADSAAGAVKGADVVVTMLPAGKHVLGVWNEVVPAMTRGALIIDSSTIDVESARAAHALAAKSGVLSVDAPVSGGTGGAKGGTLTFMCGGDDKAFAAAKPVLENMGKKIVHCGGGGAGQAAKICNNMILGISMIAVSEAFALGEKLGLSHQALFDVASTSSGQCWSLTTYCPVPGPVPTSPANNDYKPGFASALMVKDLTLAQDAAKAAGAATPLGKHAQEIYQSFDAAGQGGVDFSGIIKHVRSLAGK
ncbi:3-hydroxyisobutyrate dehydrogenase [Bradyrhizobium sp. U531]|uniref:3-hydroxyisobutyrate dehydrogenase n=1 Tax=Bradyrhizobium sp. U531 TaxID=3053458 RepID=UPI003F437F2E